MFIQENKKVLNLAGADSQVPMLTHVSLSSFFGGNSRPAGGSKQSSKKKKIHIHIKNGSGKLFDEMFLLLTDVVRVQLSCI